MYKLVEHTDEQASKYVARTLFIFLFLSRIRPSKRIRTTRRSCDIVGFRGETLPVAVSPSGFLSGSREERLFGIRFYIGTVIAVSKLTRSRNSIIGNPGEAYRALSDTRMLMDASLVVARGTRDRV